MVCAFEEFINKSNQYGSLPFIAPTLQLDQDYRNMFNILITSADDNLSINLVYLFSNITISDIISCMEDGDYSFCLGDQFFCPGYTGGRAQEFGMFMNYDVNLACPLYISIDFSLKYREFLQKYY